MKTVSALAAPHLDDAAVAGLFVRRNVFDPDECRELCLALDQADGRASSVVRGGIDRVDERVRKTRTLTPSPEVRASVAARLASYKDELSDHLAVTLARAQAPVFLRYAPGNFFRPHVDRSGDVRQPAAVKARLVTAVVFLNSSLTGTADDNAFVGGELVLYRLTRPAIWADFALTVHGEAGMLVGFPSSVLHEVAPVAAGVRYSIASWFE